MSEHPHSGLRVRNAGPKGRGVFALRPFPKGSSVLAFGGPLIPEDEIEDFTYTIQVDHGLYLGSSGGIDDRVNHCCEPSCMLRNQPPGIELVALRDIAVGEEITFDYASCISCGPTLRSCFCGAATCRGSVGTFWELDAATQARLRRLGAVPRYVLESKPVRATGRRSS